MAVFPPPAEAAALAGALPPSDRLTPPDKWHVTLHFLGEVPVISDVTAALDAMRPLGAFALRLTGGGQFGSAAWAGLDGDVDRLTALQEAVRASFADAGFAGEERPFRPHLTVSYHGDAALRQALDGYAGGTWPVREFVLVRSRNGVYERLRSWPA